MKFHPTLRTAAAAVALAASAFPALAVDGRFSRRAQAQLFFQAIDEVLERAEAGARADARRCVESSSPSP